MFVQCSALLYDSTAVTGTLKLSTTLLRISCGIRLISFLMVSSLVCGLFSQTLSFRYFSEDCQGDWGLGNRMVRGYQFYAMWVCPMESYTWGIQVLCSRNEVATYFSNKTEHLNTSGIASHGEDSFGVKPITPGHPISKISTRLSIFWRSTWKTRASGNNPHTKEDIIRREIRWISQEMVNRNVDNFNFWDAIVLLYSSAVHGTNIVLITAKV